MRYFLIILYYIFSSFAVCIEGDIQAQVPELTSYVYDEAKLLSASEISFLEEKLSAFAKNKGTQVVVVAVAKLPADYTIEQYTLKIAEVSKLGRSKIDDWVILAIAKEDKKIRIETGYGVEGIVTDIRADQIIRTLITPKFKSNEYNTGIVDGVSALLSLLDNGELPQLNNTENLSEFNIIPVIVGVAVGSFLTLLMGLLPGSLGGGLLSTILVLTYGSLGIALLSGIFSAFLILISGGKGGSSYRNGQWHSIGGLGSGSLGGGNIGFGSGRGGGGGASGSW